MFPGRPSSTRTDDMFTIAPPPASRIAGWTARAHRNAPVTLERSTPSQSAAVNSSHVTCEATDAAALLTRSVGGPSSSVTAATIACHLRLVGDVGTEHPGPAAGRPDLCDHGLGVVAARLGAVVDGDRRAVARQPQCDGRADVLRRARDERRPSLVRPSAHSPGSIVTLIASPWLIVATASSKRSRPKRCVSSGRKRSAWRATASTAGAKVRRIAIEPTIVSSRR